MSERTATGVRLQKFDAAGSLLASVGGSVENCNAQLPIRLAFSAWGTLLVFDPVAQMMREYGRDLRLLRSWAPRAPGASVNAVAISITTDADGYIYLADISSKRLQVFRADGTAAGVSALASSIVTDWETGPATGTLWSVDVAVSDLSVVVDRSETHIRRLSWLPPGR